MPKLKEIFLGKSTKTKQKSLLTKDQTDLMSLIKKGLKSGSGPFAELFGKFNPEDFEKGVVDPAIKNFQEKILPSIQEKFIASNREGSSGLTRSLLRAGTDLQSDLSGLNYQAQQQQKQNQLAGLQTAQGVKGVENIVQPGSEGLVQGTIKGLAGTAGRVVTGGL